MSYFRKIKNEAGEDTFVEVDLTTEELPEAVVKAQKPFKDVLTESIERRQEIAALKAAKKPATSEGSEETEAVKKPATVEVPAPVVPVDPDKLFADFEQRMAAKEQARIEALKTQETELSAIVKEFGLKKDAVEILADSKNPRAVAEKLAKSAYRFDEQSSGDPDKKQIDSAVGAALKKLGLED